ncbi:MAG: hypothetical protein Q9162_006098 [Coniocarpon cinnabarinum]
MSNAGRECVPSTGIVFRHQQNASLNGAGIEETNSLQNFYAYKNSFGKDIVWVDIPNRVTFIVNADPEADFTIREARVFAGEEQILPSIPSEKKDDTTDPRIPPTYPHEPPFPHHTGLDALSAAASRDHYMPSGDATRPSSHGHAGSPHADALGVLSTPSTTYSVTATTPTFTSYLTHHPASSSQCIHKSPSDSNPSILCCTENEAHLELDEFETQHEVAFLLRHFAENLGPWMDLFDIHKFFTNYVPVKAMTNPILKNATCAYAAKQLSRVNGCKPPAGGIASTQAPSEIFPQMNAAAWAVKGAQYYDNAIHLLMQGIRDGVVDVEKSSSSAKLESFEEVAISPVEAVGTKRKCPHDSPLANRDTPDCYCDKRRKVSKGRALSDEMTAATAILCDYEQQERSGAEWQGHLDGTKSLLDIVEGSMTPLSSPGSPRPVISRARQATFWNFARQDFLSALISETQTRLNPDDLTTWREAGLFINENGFVEPSNEAAHGLPEGRDVMMEDMISNALIWILAKIVSHLAASDTGPSEGREVWEGINQEALHQKWSEVKMHLDMWYAGLPDSFKPCAQLHPVSIPSSLRDRHGADGPVFTEIWYNNPMCASAMQSYHMARMLLLLNMPQQSTFRKTTYHKRLTSYKNITAEIEAHARAICGIAASRPENAVRINSVQALFTAGQSLNTVREKRELIRFLREIETDTGWATEYRVRRLYEIWEWDANGVMAGAGT